MIMKKLLLLLAITIATASYSQTAITDSNFQQAINTCLSTNPVDGMCSDSEYGPMPDWDVSNVTSMSSAFSGNNTFNADISDWDTSNVTNMSFMFQQAPDFNQPIGGWDVSKVTDMSFMFRVVSTGIGAFNQPLNEWDVSNVTKMNRMFEGSLFNQPLNEWDVSSVIEMGGMFQDSYFNQSINNWNVENVTYMGSMFYNANDFNQDIGSWDVSNVTDMSYMFHTASAFNQPIGDWDVSFVTDMSWMFHNAGNFVQDISSWCVSNIASEPTGFSDGTQNFPESNKPVWGTCPTASIDDQNQLDISIYPNPTSDIVFIDGNYTQLKVVVYDILGKQVMKESITNSIDISQLEKGVYILQLSDGAKVTTQRIIKK